MTIPLPQDVQFGRDFFVSKKPLQANVSDGRSVDSDSTPQKKKEMDMFEFERWPHVTRFKKRMTSFRREVIAGSTHARQAIDEFFLKPKAKLSYSSKNRERQSNPSRSSEKER